jgi:hypothetical protein
MTVSSYQEYSIDPKPTKTELEMADKIIVEALTELESEPPNTNSRSEA